jgi:hypothetical protein
MVDAQSIIQAKDRLVWRKFENDIILLQLETGDYFRLNASAAFLWERLHEPHRAADLAQQLCASFDVDRESAEHDVSAALEGFLANNLITVTTIQTPSFKEQS